MRFRFLSFGVLALAALLLTAGCNRNDSLTFTAEVDEPGYRRGKELLRQGRNQEALAEFHKVVAKRGLFNAPEAHLELGLIYQNHIRDPISAIYHYRQYRDLKPNTQQAEFVRGRIAAAMREFASTLPGKPLDNPLTPADSPEIVQRLQRENEQLHAALARLRVSLGLAAQAPVDHQGNITAFAPHEAPSPISPVSPVADDVWAPAQPYEEDPVQQPSQPSRTAQQTTQAPPSRPTTQTTPPAQAGRRHIVKQGEGLWTIARQYYGTATNAQVEAIYNANRDRMSSKSDLKVGMELRIP